MTSEEVNNSERKQAQSDKNHNRKKAWISWKEIVLFAFVLIGIQWWQHRDLLPNDGSIVAPTFQLPSLNGELITYDAQSNRPTVFYFFAPWCNICHVSIDNLNSIKDSIEKNEVEVFIIALDWQSIEEVEQFVSEHDLPVPVLLGTRQQQYDFQIKAFPTYYIADNRGFLQSGSIGYSTSVGIQTRLSLLL